MGARLIARRVLIHKLIVGVAGKVLINEHGSTVLPDEWLCSSRLMADELPR